MAGVSSPTEDIMATSQIPLTGGPDKADLLRAVSNPGQHLHASFGTPDGLLEAHIDAIEERGSDGVDFTVWGHLASSNLRGAYFTGSYNCETRTGRLALKTADT
jgi:hypothetical protein